MPVALERKPAFAGQFYPDDPEELRDWIGRRLARTKPSVEGEVKAIVSPHAGYVFSGSLAAKAFKALEGMDLEAVILLGPVHRDGISFASVLTDGSYSTPLGEVPIHSELALRIAEREDDIRASVRGHTVDGVHDEHSLEVQIPFLQMVQPDVPIVPIVFGNHSCEFARRLSSAIYRAIRDTRTVLVASTDLSHYFSYRDAKHLDRVFLREIERFSVENLAEALEARKTMACGAGPVLTSMITAEKMGANEGKVIKWATSADSPYRDYTRVVGYVAAAFSKVEKPDAQLPEDKKGEEKETVSGAGAASTDTPGKPAASSTSNRLNFDSITDEQKLALLRTTRLVVRNAVLGEQPPHLRDEDPVFHLHCGCFVTLKKEGQLRGCIGFVDVNQPLATLLKEAGKAAALRDPRFQPVSRAELNDLDIEVSLLSQPEPIEAEDVVPGRHGLMLTSGGSRGLLLPQVAAERGWDRETYLENICLKAGLNRNCWQAETTKLQAFTALVIDEKDFR